MDIVRARVRVEGAVQGVYFRASCLDKAEQMGVAGWVRNCTDGAVEAEFQGSEDAVRAMIDWCRHGPAGARVTGLNVEWEEPEPGEASFHIVR